MKQLFTYLSALILCSTLMAADASFKDFNNQYVYQDPAYVHLPFPDLFVGFDIPVHTQVEPLNYKRNNTLTTSTVSSFLNTALSLGFYSKTPHFIGEVIFRSAPKQAINDNFSFYYANRFEAGFKFLPFKLRTYGLRPYAGASLVLSEYQQFSQLGDHAPMISHLEMIFSGGFLFDMPVGLLDIGGAISPSQVNLIDYPSIDNAGQNYSTGLPYARAWFRYSHYLNPEKMVEKKLLFSDKKNALSTSLGYSGAYRVINDHNVEKNNHTFTPTATMGYYLDAWQSSLLLSYRPYDFEHRIGSSKVNYVREVLGVEFIKYLGDFDGSVHFIGLGLNNETLQRKTKVGDTTTTLEASVQSVGFIFGWETQVYNHPRIAFRTTFRYNPLTFLEFEETKINFEQFEFTFFELVVYPARLFE